MPNCDNKLNLRQNTICLVTNCTQNPENFTPPRMVWMLTFSKSAWRQLLSEHRQKINLIYEFLPAAWTRGSGTDNTQKNPAYEGPYSFVIKYSNQFEWLLPPKWTLMSCHWPVY